MVRVRCPLGSGRAAPNHITRSSPLLHSRRRRSRFTRDASDTSPCRRAGDSSQRARPPQGEQCREGEAPEESRPPCVRGNFPLPRRLSSSALGRRAASAGRWLQMVEIANPVTGAGANPSEAGSGNSRRETIRDRVPQERLIDRGRRWCPSSAGSSPHRAGGHEVASRSVHLFLFARGLGFGWVTTPESASRRRGPACATGGTRSGPASPPGSTGPSSCHACAPAAASTPWPPAGPGA
jgi:hypothetical protein